MCLWRLCASGSFCLKDLAMSTAWPQWKSGCEKLWLASMLWCMVVVAHGVPPPAPPAESCGCGVCVFGGGAYGLGGGWLCKQERMAGVHTCEYFYCVTTARGERCRGSPLPQQGSKVPPQQPIADATGNLPLLIMPDMSFCLHGKRQVR